MTTDAKATRACLAKIAAHALRANGVAHIPRLFEPALIETMLTRFRRERPELFGDPTLLMDKSIVGTQRYLFPLPLEPDEGAFELLFAPLLTEFFGETLGAAWELEAYGLIIAFPGAKDQHLHRDGGLLYPETGLDRVIPVTAMTVAIPLVDCDARTGHTRFAFGSHRFPDPEPEESDAVGVDLAVGDGLAWDFRIQHLGAANLSDAPRPMIYATVCRSFWTDHKNLVPGHNARLTIRRDVLAELDDALLRRLVRADCGDGRPALSEADYRRLVGPATQHQA